MRKLAQSVGWPLFALASAFALWITFVGSPELVTSISVPVLYENLPPGLESASKLPERVELEIRGPAAGISRVDRSSAGVVVNLASVHQPGERTFTIERRNVDLPPGVHVVRAIPGQLRLSFERRLEAQVPIRVRLAQPPPDGYRIAAEYVRPGMLKIAGPETRVRQIQSAETDPIDLSRVIGKAQFQVHTFLSDSQVRFVSPPVVQVSITLEKTLQGGAAPDGQTTVRN
jgi:YbbR domain-containing protein